MEQNRKDYIVIRRPANNLGKSICPIYLVISREHLSKYVDKYLDGKIKRNPNLSAFEDYLIILQVVDVNTILYLLLDVLVISILKLIITNVTSTNC